MSQKPSGLLFRKLTDLFPVQPNFQSYFYSTVRTLLECLNTAKQLWMTLFQLEKFLVETKCFSGRNGVILISINDQRHESYFYLFCRLIEKNEEALSGWYIITIITTFSDKNNLLERAFVCQSTVFDSLKSSGKEWTIVHISCRLTVESSFE